MRLSGADLTKLQLALATLLSPFDFESVDAWRKTTRTQIAALLQCDKSASLLPLDGQPGFQTDITIPVTEYAHYNGIDPAADIFRSLGDKAFIWPTLRARYEQPSPERWRRSEFYNDWVRKQGLCQPCGMIVVRKPEQLPAIPFANWQGMAGLWFYWANEAPAATGERELAILQLLLPAFEASLHLLVQGARENERIAQALGGIGEGAVIVNDTGRIVYENGALTHLLRNEPEHPRIRAACCRFGRLLLSSNGSRKSKPEPLLNPTHEDVRTSVARYRFRGTLLGRSQFGSSPRALVVVARTEPVATSVQRLGHRYHLTSREVAVAGLVARGQGNGAIAQQLGLSVHTVRRHVEHILLKLGVHSRAAIPAKILAADDEIESFDASERR